MINRIIDFCAHNRLLILALAATAAILGWRSMRTLPLDALPDLSDKQVIIRTRWDRSPELVDAQVTYPIISALLGAPHVKAVRGFSDFGSSFVYVIFDDNTDLYWARSRIVEYLSSVTSRLPEGVVPELGPDATGLGWVFQYVLVDRSGKHTLADLRSYQDWYLSYWLKTVPGVAEVASVGGFVRQYQVNVDPDRLRAFHIPFRGVVEALRTGNRDASGQFIESGGNEYLVHGRGYVRSVTDLENILAASTSAGTPILVRDIAHVSIASEVRRGLADFDGTGETVSGIIVMRQDENVLDVIDRVKAKIAQIAPSLPPGVQIIPIYDRSELIRHSIGNLKSTLREIILAVVVVILLFLWHFPSALVPIITIPLTVLIAFLPFRLLGISANIMSLGGIAIAAGALVDAAIVVVEQTHKRLEEWDATGRREDYHAVIVDAVKQVAGPSFFALLVIAVSFLPVLTLEGQEGRLFGPLAYTKTLAMVIAAVLTITLDPALRLFLARRSRFHFRPRWASRIMNSAFVGVIHSEEEHPISRRVIRLYEPVVSWAIQNKALVIGVALALILVTIPVWKGLGTEFMPPLNEEALLYMPTTIPTISGPEAQRLLQLTDRILKQFPEVDHVLGKAGRAYTATDPAPLSMFETIITLRPMNEWRRVPTWYSGWMPGWLKPLFRHITADHIPLEDLIRKMDQALKIPGLINSWSMPVRARTDMLSTGLRTSLGVKIAGDRLDVIERIASQIESLLPLVKGTRSAFAERIGQGYYLDIQWDRNKLAQNGLALEEAQNAIQYAIGGENVTTLLDGRERYPVNIRYAGDFRDTPQSIRRVLVSTADGNRQIPIGQLASVRARSGPSMLRNENGLLTGYVYVDVDGRDISSYVNEASRLVAERIKPDPGYTISWSGQYEAIARMKRRLLEIVPVTLFIIILLLYMSTRCWVKTAIVMLAVPFSSVGAVWLVYWLGYHMNVAIGVGFIALLGVDAETGVFMLLYLDQAYRKRAGEGRMLDAGDLRQAILEGAAKRVRPKLMTATTMLAGLLPIMWSDGTGSEVMKQIAAPLIGGIASSFVLELVVYPPIYYAWKSSVGYKGKSLVPG